MDACLGEKDPTPRVRCIRLNQDCANVCEATGKVLSRQTAFEPAMAQAILQACVVACRLCADWLARHRVPRSLAALAAVLLAVVLAGGLLAWIVPRTVSALSASWVGTSSPSWRCGASTGCGWERPPRDPGQPVRPTLPPGLLAQGSALDRVALLARLGL